MTSLKLCCCYLVVFTRSIAATGTEVCIKTGSRNAMVAWPKNSQRGSGSCACSLWFRIKQCSCIQQSNFFHSFNRKISSAIFLCWEHILNNTLITVYKETFISNRGGYPSITKEITESYSAIIPGMNITHSNSYRE